MADSNERYHVARCNSCPEPALTRSKNKAPCLVAEELTKITGGEHWKHQNVSWQMSEGCRFAVVLSDGNPPIGGLAMPAVATRSLEILEKIGVPNMVEMAVFPGWHMTPCLFLDFDGMTGRDRMDQTIRLTDDAASQTNTIRKIVDYVMLAAQKTKEQAGTIGAAMDFTRAKWPAHPQWMWIIPVGYQLIGRGDDAAAYMEEQLSRIRAEKNKILTELYESFAVELLRP